MAELQLQFSNELIQQYVLDVEPNAFEEIQKALIKAGNEMSAEQQEVGAWDLYVWLNRPAIWAIRPVKVTSGLDTFLLGADGLPGVTDVAEWIAPVIIDVQDSRSSPVGRWSDLDQSGQSGALLFATFIWLDWDVLAATESWDGEPAPPRPKILAAMRRALACGLARIPEFLKNPPPVLLASTTGDADLILYGRVHSTNDLDRCLYLLMQIGCDTLSAEVFGWKAAELSPQWPVVRSSRTELAVPLTLYQSYILNHRCREITGREVLGQITGKVSPEIALNRGHGPIIALKNRLKDIVANVDGEWEDCAVFGQEDLVVRPCRNRGQPVDFCDMLRLLTRLDAARVEEPGFPCRTSLRLAFTTPVGRESPVSRSELFQVISRLETPPPLPDRSMAGSDAEWIQALDVMIRSLRACGWREDLRIVERVAERCVTLSKSKTLPLRTRQMLRVALRRFGTICQQIHEYEKHLEVTARELQPGANHLVEGALRREIQLLRRELHYSGTRMDRVLSHHSRGTISLLLSASTEARGPVHISSDTNLSAGLDVLFRSPVRRLIQFLTNQKPANHVNSKWLRQLVERLETVAKPIIYASHEPDFRIWPGLTLLHVPTWALWQVGACTHLLHELGHALAVEGSLEYIVRKMLWRLLPGRRCACLLFEQRMADLGLIEGDSIGRVSKGLPHVANFARSFYSEAEQNDSGDSLPAGDRNRLHTLEEIAADTVERVLCYRAGPSGDRAHLSNCLNTISPSLARENWMSNVHRLLRLWSAQAAVRSAMVIRLENLLPMGVDHNRVSETVADSWRDFREWVHEWVETFLKRPECKFLSRATCDSLRNMAASLPSMNDQVWISYFHFTQTISLVLAFGPVYETQFRSIFNATLVWGGLLGISTLTPDDEEGLRAHAEQLSNGMVPDSAEQRPERLMSELSLRYREIRQSTIPAHVRQAFSLYLTSL